MNVHEGSTLLVAVAQPATVPLDPVANARIHAQVLRSARARLVVFPELSLCGYEFAGPAIPVDHDAFSMIAEACAETGSVALVGAPVRPVATDGRPAISVVAVSADGTEAVYHKVHLGADEANHFVAGSGPATIDLDGWRIGLTVCRDTGIAEHVADTVALGVDLLVAGLVESAAQASVPARRAVGIATEHGVWVAMASQAGPTGQGYHQTAGRSAIWRPDGTAVAMAGGRPGDIAVAVLSKEPGTGPVG